MINGASVSAHVGGDLIAAAVTTKQNADPAGKHYATHTRGHFLAPAAVITVAEELLPHFLSACREKRECLSTGLSMCLSSVGRTSRWRSPTGG